MHTKKIIIYHYVYINNTNPTIPAIPRYLIKLALFVVTQSWYRKRGAQRIAPVGLIMTDTAANERYIPVCL